MRKSETAKKRGYELGKRLEQMDQTRRAVLDAARARLEGRGYRELSMGTLAADSGVTRQTIHNLFGSKRGVVEALFDNVALHGGMDQMREVMAQDEPRAMLRGFVRIFCSFWAENPVFIRRMHGIGAIDPEFGEIIAKRNERRLRAANRISAKLLPEDEALQGAAALTALTSFEFFDTLTTSGIRLEEAEAVILSSALAALQHRSPGQ